MAWHDDDSNERGGAAVTFELRSAVVRTMATTVHP
jgi:hypothetical protein